IDTCTFENNDGIEAQVIKTNTDATIVNSEITGNLLVKKVNDAKVEAFDTTINGVKVDYTSFDDTYWFNVANYKELVQLVEKTKNWGMECIIANLTGTDYTWTESIVIDNTYTPDVFFIYGGNKAIDAGGNQFLTVGAGKQVGIINLTVKNAKADIGAAVINHGRFAAVISTFENNEALYYGGAIYSDANLEVMNSTFNDNFVSTIEAYNDAYGGGAIFSSGKLTVSESKFNSNYAAHRDEEPAGNGGFGGAINVLNTTDDVTIVNSYFTENNARHGGAIYIEDLNGGNEGKVLIKNNTFEENFALYGGAINSCHNSTIDNNTFTANYVKGEGSGGRHPMGGALCLQDAGTETTFEVTNNKFINNEAMNGEGGAVISDTTNANKAEFVSENNLYKGNKATFVGAVDLLTKGSFTKDQFIDNSATGIGAIGIQGTPVTINECTFSGNTADRMGDALYVTKPITITGSDITSDNLETFINTPNNAVITATDNTVNGVHLDTDLISTKVNVTVDNDEMFVGEENAITGTLIDATDVGVFNKTVTVYVGGTEVGSNKTDVNGVFTVYYTPTGNVGSDITVQAKFEPATDDYYIGNTSEEKTVRIKSKTSIVVDQFTTNPYVNNEVTVTGTLIDSSSNGIQGKTVDVYVNGVLNGTTTDVTGADGKFTYKFTPDTIGDYNISAKFNGDDSYGVSESANVTLKVVSFAHINIVPPEVGWLGSDVTITGNLTDDLGNVITGKNITVTRVDAGVDPYNVTTDETTGIFTVTFSPTEVGTNRIRLDFTEEEYYTPSTMTETYVTVRSTTNITLDEITEDYLLNDTMEIVVTGKLTDALGRGLDGVAVAIIVDGSPV
ncbi:MAG: hypothetical protein BZ135_09235, partial [Methanosphaera sp. rholeuAM6]